MDSSVWNFAGLVAIVGFYVGGFWFWLKPKRSSSREVGSANTDESVSVFGRRRLPRGDPHMWADKLEDWFARLTGHMKFLYFLVISLGVALAAHIIYAH